MDWPDLNLPPINLHNAPKDSEMSIWKLAKEGLLDCLDLSRPPVNLAVVGTANIKPDFPAARGVIVLENWAIFELTDGRRHIAGHDSTGGDGHVSTRLMFFDPKTRRAVTENSQVYELRQPGLYGDGAHAWGRWCRVHDVYACKDVSNKVLGE